MKDVITWINENQWMLASILLIATMLAGMFYEMSRHKELRKAMNRAQIRLLARGQKEMLDALHWRDIEKEADPMALFLDVMVRMEAGVRQELKELSWLEKIQATNTNLLDQYGYPDAGIDEIDREMAHSLHYELESRGVELPHPETCWLQRQCTDLVDESMMATQRLLVSEGSASGARVMTTS